MTDITDSDMTVALVERFGINYSRAAEVADAIVNIHGRVDIWTLSNAQCREAGRIADLIKKLDAYDWSKDA